MRRKQKLTPRWVSSNSFTIGTRCGAQQEFNRALTLNPRYASAHHGYALAYGFLGQMDESLKWIGTALEIEPLSLILNANKGYLLYIARRYDESISQLQKTLEIDPSFAATHHRLGLAYCVREMHREAILHFQEAQRFSDDSPLTHSERLGTSMGRQAREAEAHEILRRLPRFRKAAMYQQPLWPRFGPASANTMRRLHGWKKP